MHESLKYTYNIQIISYSQPDVITILYIFKFAMLFIVT